MATRRRHLAQRRRTLGYSQEALADKLGADRSTIARWERGTCDPHPHFRPRLGQLLRLTATELAALLKPETEPTPTGPLSQQTPDIPDLGVPKPDAAAIRATSAHLIDLDGRFGGGDIVDLATRAAHTARRAAATHPAGTSEMLSAVAEAQQIAGWLAYDADRQQLSQQLTQDALCTARLAGDRSTELMALSQLAMQAVYLHQPREAEQLSEDTLTTRLTPRVRALFVLRQSRAAGQLGDTTRALTLLRETRSRHQDGTSHRDPPWAWWLDDAELSWHHGMIHADTGAWAKAAPLFATAAHHRPADYRWAILNDHIHLFLALVHLRVWPDAQHILTTHILPVIGEVASPRNRRLLHHATQLALRSKPSPSLREALETPPPDHANRSRRLGGALGRRT